MSDSLTNHSFEFNLFSELVLFVNKTSKHKGWTFHSKLFQLHFWPASINLRLLLKLL